MIVKYDGLGGTLTGPAQGTTVTLPSPCTAACSHRTCSAAHRRPCHPSGPHGATELIGAEPIHAVDEAELALARDCAQGDREQLRCKQQQRSGMGDEWQAGLCSSGPWLTYTMKRAHFSL